jgi:hypothetical protein
VTFRQRVCCLDHPSDKILQHHLLNAFVVSIVPEIKIEGPAYRQYRF